jgi:putative salt-induced outer membrane protein
VRSASSKTAMTRSENLEAGSMRAIIVGEGLVAVRGHVAVLRSAWHRCAGFESGNRNVRRIEGRAASALYAALYAAVCPALAALGLLWAGPAAGQASAKEQGLTGKAALGFLATSGNTESKNANASLGLVYALETWAHRFDLSAIGASTADQTTAEAYKAKYEARRSIGEHGFAFTALDWNRDRFSGFEQQLSMTSGYGRRLIDRERHALDASVGLGARESVPLGGARERDGIVRGGLNYVWTLSDTSELDQTVVIESGSTNTSTDSLTALKAGLFGDVALVLSYRLKHNSAVPVGTVSTDRFSSISLEYSF